MKQLLIIFLLITQYSFSQEKIITSARVPVLNAKIDSLENLYRKNNVPQFRSLPQTTGHFFWLKTKDPGKFLSALENNEPLDLDSLLKIFPDLQLDRDILILKNLYTTSSGERRMEIKSFRIKNNRDHRISLDYQDSPDQKGIRFFYSSSLDRKSGKTRIYGFLLNEDFSQQAIPAEYAGRVLYTDLLVQPSEALFLKRDTGAIDVARNEHTAIDSLLNYYADITRKPVYAKEQDVFDHRQQIDQWEQKRAAYADSLFKNDEKFRSLLLRALDYAESNDKSNGELELFVAQLISKRRALELLRKNQQVGSCSFDNGPIEQQKRMARLAAEIPDWSVFIKSFLNVMNDNVSRIASSNIATNSRKTYIEELTKLDLDVKSLLLGSNMRISDTSSDHYFSDGAKIGKAFSSLENDDKDYFESFVEQLIKTPEVDPFNKLHFYNTYRHYQYHLNDTVRKELVDQKIKNLSTYMPAVIQTRIENPNKELTDLLYREKDKLEDFIILDSSIGNIYSYSYGGDCWMAEIQEKHGNPKIIYDLTMPIEDTITPFNNFLEQKTPLTERIEEHEFINELLSSDPGNKLYLKFTKDRSFINFQNKVLNDMPPELSKNFNFENAVSFYIAKPNRQYVRYLLFENKDVMILKIPKDFTIPGYTFEELVNNKKESFLSVTYESYKLFNERGEMLN